MADLITDPEAWAEMEFGDCDLGDLRRTRRAVRLAAQVARNPGASTPGQAKAWKDLKAAYRLFDTEDVTLEALAEPHWMRTRNPGRGTWLLLCGETRIERIVESGSRRRDKSPHRPVGFVLHSSLLVDRTGCRIGGLADQVIPRHDGLAVTPAGSVRAWRQLVDEIGPPAAGRKLMYVFNQAGADFETLCHLMQNRAGWIVQPPRANRRIHTREGRPMTLRDFAQTLPLAGACRWNIPVGPGEPTSPILCEARFGSAFVPRPVRCPAWIAASGLSWIPVSLIQLRPARPVPGQATGEWYLWTSEHVATLAACRRVIGWFNQWPLIEEFHGVLKEDCHLTHRRFRSVERLQAATGMFSVVAVRILQMRRSATE